MRKISGIIVVLALPLLRIRFLMGMGKMAPLLLIVGLLIFALGAIGKKRKQDGKK